MNSKERTEKREEGADINSRQMKTKRMRGYLKQQEKTMANKKIWLRILVMVIGVTIIGCDGGGDGDGGGGDGNPGRILVIATIPADVYRRTGYLAQIGLFSVGTTLEQAYSFTGCVAGAYLFSVETNEIGGPEFFTVSFILNDLNNIRWKGSGIYDVYLNLHDRSGTVYKASSVSFSSETTTVPFSSFVQVAP